MALTLAQAGANNSTTSSATLVVTSTVSWAAGDMVVVCIAADNAGTQGAVSISSVTDSKSHTYTQRVIQNNDPGAASAGATAAIYTAFVTTAMTTSDTITVNFSPNTTSKAAVVWKATVASTEFPKYLSNGGTTGSTANPSLASTSVANGDGVIYVLAAESNATLTGDSDTLNGSWAGLYQSTANSGTSATSMIVGSQNKVVNAAGAQTWNTTLTAADWSIGYIILDPALKVGRTGTSAGTGSSSSNRTVRRLRTATSSGTGTSSATSRKVKQRTATAAGTGTSSATRAFIRVRTATAAGVGTSSAARTILRFRTATSLGSATQTAVRRIIRFRTATAAGLGGGSGDCDFIHTRTATAAGIGSGTATGERSGFETFQRTATASGIGGGEADKDLVHIRTASSSGIGTSTALRRFARPRTATGAGSSSSTVTRLIKRPRTATAAGTGTSSLVSRRIPCRTATAAGTGTSTAARRLTAKRTTTAAGIGTSTVLRRLTAKRTSTTAGTGTSTSAGCRMFRKTATASGTGTSAATQNKLFIFRTPTGEVNAADFFAKDIANRLFSYAEPTTRGKNIYKLLDGTFTDIEQRDEVAKTYYGGSNNFVSADEKAELIAAGYGAYVT